MNKPHTKYKNKDGTVVPSCTTIIKNLGWSTPALMGWCRKVAMAGQDPYKIRDVAADAGTLTHKYIEAFETNKELSDDIKKEYTFDQIIIAEKGLEQYKKWKIENEVNDSSSQHEIGGVSEQYQFGFTIDCITHVKGCFSLLDYKTSKYITPEHIIQVSSYKKAYEEVYENHVGQVILIHISKEPKDELFITPYPISDEQLDAGWEVFKHLRSIHDYKEMLRVQDDSKVE